MALNALELSVSSGTRGRPFVADISEATDGSSIEPLVNFTPGFNVVNGQLRHDALPYDVNTVVLRETLAGQDAVETKFQIPAYSVDNPVPPEALPAEQAIVEDDVALVVPVTGEYVDTITPTVVDNEVTGFVLS
jgi:hypothetical protein